MKSVPAEIVFPAAVYGVISFSTLLVLYENPALIEILKASSIGPILSFVAFGFILIGLGVSLTQLAMMFLVGDVMQEVTELREREENKRKDSILH